MRSTLTRSVFRRILAQKSYLAHQPSGCLRRPNIQRSGTSSVFRYEGSRMIISFSGKRVKEIRDHDLAPGLETMMELAAMKTLHGRPPKIESLVKAWQDFFTYKKRLETPVRGFQVIPALTTFEYLQEKKSIGRISAELLDMAMRSLTIPVKDDLRNHRALADFIFEELIRRREGNSLVLNIVNSKLLDPYITILCRSGGSLEALELAKDSWKHCTTKPGRRLWTTCLEGLSLENREMELLKTIQLLEQEGVPFDSRMHKSMTVFYSSRNNVEKTKEWYSHPIADTEGPLDSTNHEILQFSLRNNQLQWCGEAFQKQIESNPSKRAWGSMILWAAANRSSVETVEQVMSLKAESDGDGVDLSSILNIHTINNLVDLARSMDDSDAAERYIALGHKWNIQPNARTHLLRIEHRLQARDLESALWAYKDLQNEESPRDAYSLTVNRLLRAVCQNRESDFDTVSSILTDLEDRRVGLEPETVAALCKIYLKRNEQTDALNILFTHSFHFSGDERQNILKVFIEYITDPKNDIDQIWDAFAVVTQVFVDIGIELRTVIMEEFFQRDRSDMGLYVFRQIKQTEAERDRPSIDTYVKCLKGLGHNADVKGLETISNTLKLDFAIDPNTKLYNALMLAFTACEEPRKSMEFWDEIVRSPEGPDHNSIQLALQACEKLPFGLKRAREIWIMLDEYQIDATNEIFATYIGALAGQRQTKEAQKLIEQRQLEDGREPDAILLGTLYNATLGLERSNVESWASTKFPKSWAKLQDYGKVEDVFIPRYNIDRTVVL